MNEVKDRNDIARAMQVRETRDYKIDCDSERRGDEFE